MLTKIWQDDIIAFAVGEAWLSLVERCVRDAEAAGSNPVASTIWFVGQAVKTPPSHGGNRGSIPLRTTLRKNDGSCSFLVFSSGIEVVITGLTRNQFAGNRTGVRIPPAAHQKAGETRVLPAFYVEFRPWNWYDVKRSR